MNNLIDSFFILTDGSINSIVLFETDGVDADEPAGVDWVVITLHIH